MIRERLDRFLGCEECSALFPHARVRNYPIYRSDHAPILLETEEVKRGLGRRKRFHFEAL